MAWCQAVKRRKATNQTWRRHKDDAVQRILEQFDELGWTITDQSTYYKAFCPCPSKHKRWVHLTPSDPNYAKNLAAWLRRQPCTPGRTP